MFGKNLFYFDSDNTIRLKFCGIILFYLQIAIMCMAIGSFVWNLVAEIKTALHHNASTEYNVWTSFFLHPVEASLINYLITSLVMFLYFIYIYSRLNQHPYPTMSFICRRASFRNQYVMLLLVVFFLPFAVKSSCSLHLKTASSVCMILLAFFPARYISVDHNVASISSILKDNRVRIVQILRSAAVIASLLIFGAMVLEAFCLIKGPVYVLNEFLPLPSMPQIDGKYINISDLPARIEPSLRDKLVLENIREYFYQISNRGVFHHIGHVLNPVNEYIYGKHTSEIYFQYGLGFSFVYKWTMELFGGLAVQNYFKCHIFYILYWVIYISLSTYLFRSAFYVFLSVLALASSFFMLGYDAFVIAPGINPLIHFFDLPLLFFLFRYFKDRNVYDISIALGLGTIGILLNQQFGLLGMLAAILTLALFYLENDTGPKRLRLLALLPFVVIVPLVISRFFLPVATDNLFGYFLKGYFSWEPDIRFVAVIITNAALSYAFLLLKRNDTTPFKYLFVFLFLYFQALLVYYYWSGLSNHFWPLFPFMGLQLLVMMQMLEQSPLFRSQSVKVVCSVVILGVSVVMLVNASKVFYGQKKSYSKVFTSHKVYSWDFDRARIRSTINPVPLDDSVTLLQRYSGPGTGSKGVVIISVFDNVLPILAKRYSLMPFFDMQWYSISRKEVNESVKRIKQLKPEYIFVGHEIETEPTIDPWRYIFEESVLENERTSAFGRLRELKKIFKAVSPDYTPIEKGQLLTVYKQVH